MSPCRPGLRAASPANASLDPDTPEPLGSGPCEAIPPSSRLDELPVLVRAAGVAILLWLFLVAIGWMSVGFKALGSGFGSRLLSVAGSPLAGLFAGLLATSLVQSSSLSTSIVVGMVSAGSIPVRGAIPIVMGANIGTAVTNTLVALGYVGSRGSEFRRAFAAATVHDFFNLSTVFLMLPLELAGQVLFGFGPLEAAATGIAARMPQASLGAGPASPLAPFLDPAVKGLAKALPGILGSDQAAALALVGIGLASVALTLAAVTALLRSLVLARLAHRIEEGAEGGILAGVLIGFAVTAMVQSSSITTSLLVPLAAAGAFSLPQAFPLTVGANLGTTVTALLASLGATRAGLEIALVHFLFNLAGALIFLPWPAFRRIPIGLADRLSRLAEHSRAWGLAFVAILYFGVPALLLALL